jgi:hypothetical protein
MDETTGGKKVRAFGVVACVLALAYYSYQVYNYAVNWYTEDEIEDGTK